METHVSSTTEPDRRVQSMSRLLAAVQDLSLARSVDAVVRVVRTVARELTGADGASFILRDRNQCHYVDEDAIGPLWKGQRFPLEACVSGWSMINRKPAVIPDIFDDPRVPVDAYRPTFVKSLVMVPIRTVEPIGAIGTYWARHYRAAPFEVELLQILANTTSVALENVRIYEELERRVQERTSELQAANEALKAFSFSVSHDLRSPLTTITGFASMGLHEIDTAAGTDFREHFEVIGREADRMRHLIDDLLHLAAASRAELTLEPVDVSVLAREALERQRQREPTRHVDIRVAPDLRAHADKGLLAAVVDNLASNAWKYTSKQERACIEFGRHPADDSVDAFYFRDNGAGFDMAAAGELFTPFKRMHSPKEFAGSGVGLATVRRIIERHGGRVWAAASPGQGATFTFTLPRPVTDAPRTQT